jgi:hypothetical protein
MLDDTLTWDNKMAMDNIKHVILPIMNRLQEDVSFSFVMAEYKNVVLTGDINDIDSISKQFGYTKELSELFAIFHQMMGVLEHFRAEVDRKGVVSPIWAGMPYIE